MKKIISVQCNNDKDVRRPLLRLANHVHKGHLEGGPATMTTNVTRVEQILYVMVKNQLLFQLVFLYNYVEKVVMSAIIVT